ncbi:MAG: hypothetical protein HY909_11995 [Deltaproteobacteria bacterium]|nr:hypothetical protein [Deltaproteobacteria bacterium]
MRSSFVLLLFVSVGCLNSSTGGTVRGTPSVCTLTGATAELGLWTAQAPQRCSPGEGVVVGCSAGCGVGSCTGDPVVRVCDGATSPEQCAANQCRLGENDDNCMGLCPATSFICPSSGTLTVLVRRFSGSTAEFTCNVALRAGALGSPTPPTTGGGTCNCSSVNRTCTYTYDSAGRRTPHCRCTPSCCC